MEICPICKNRVGPLALYAHRIKCAGKQPPPQGSNPGPKRFRSTSGERRFRSGLEHHIGVESGDRLARLRELNRNYPGDPKC